MKTNKELEALLSPLTVTRCEEAATYKKEIYCPKCHGSGIHETRHFDVRTCWTCYGAGSVDRTRFDRRHYRSQLFNAVAGRDIVQRGNQVDCDIILAREECGETDTAMGQTSDGMYRGICGGYARVEE